MEVSHKLHNPNVQCQKIITPVTIQTWNNHLALRALYKYMKRRVK